MTPAVLFRHLRLAVRSLAKTPAFTLTVAVTLALGIGANSAVFSAIDAVLLKDLPFPEAGRLMRLTQHDPRNSESGVAPVRLLDWDRRNDTFQAITGYYTEDASELSGDLPERLKRAFVAPRFLEVWGVAPALGRDFNPAEARFGGPAAVLISDRYWRKRFGASASVLGKQLQFKLGRSTIVGVMPASFLFEDREVDLWSPVYMDAPFAQSRLAVWFNTIGRLKPGVAVQAAQANLTAVQTQLGREFGRPDSELTAKVEPLKERTVGEMRRSLWLVFGAVSVLLLIACTNIAGLLLARVAQREQEVAVRFSLGASRASVVVQLLAEAFVLSIAGSALGLALAFGATRVFRGLAAGLPRVDELALDGRIVGYTLACAVATTFLCGLVPALRGSRGGLALNVRGQVSGRNATQWMLVGVQVALAVTLLVGAGLLLRSFEELGRVSPGFEARNVLTMRISSSWAEAGDWGRRASDELETVPGVERVAMGFALPGVPTEFPSELIRLDGRTGNDAKLVAETRFVAPGYFELMRIPVVEGETCPRQNGPGFTPALANRSFANRHFPGETSIGHHLRIGANPNQPPLRIVGVVADVRESGINKAPAPLLYGCGAGAFPVTWFLVKTRTEPTALVGALRRKLREVEPTRSLFDAAPLEARLSDAFAQDRLRTVLLAAFAATAVALASVGLYGTLSYFMSVRRREVGLRLALGAGRRRVAWQFLARGLWVAALGCLAGLGLAAGFSRVLAGMLFGVSAWDPLALSAVIAIMMGVAALASFVPAAHAAVLQPMQVLRDE